MALYIQIFLGLLILASLVIAYYSARTWHWGHVLVVLGIFLSTLGFFVLAAETLRIHAVLRKQVNDLERDLAQVKTQNNALVRGTDDGSIIGQLTNQDPPVALLADDAEQMESLASLDHQLLLATRIRGRVWRNVAPQGVDPQTGAVNVAVEAPATLPSDTVVYLFEQGPATPAEGAQRGAQYLGEFRITESAGQQATLAPVLPMDASDPEIQRLAASQGPWVIYERMPVDRHEVFANLSDEALKRLLPESSVEEYLRHGAEAVPDDPDERKVGFDENGVRLPTDQLDQAAKVVYQRRLRDYATEFDELLRRRTLMEADIEAVQADIERLAGALASAEKLRDFRRDEIARLNKDLAGVRREREAIEQHLAQVERQLARVKELLAETMQRNSRLADELAARQLRAGNSIDGATSPVESTGPLALDVVN